MLDMLKQWLKPYLADSRQIDQIYQELKFHYPAKDPWGLDLKTHRKFCEVLWPFYKHYFRVQLHGETKVQNEPYLIIANHSGQIAIDALLIMMAFLWEIKPPRVARGMVARFLPELPFIGELVTNSGSVLGDRKNCLDLLKHKETLLVFPEGVSGISKPSSEYYHLKHFTTGFFRMALTTQTKVLPIAVVGAEEFYPYVMHLPTLAKALNLPAFPITPTFPWLGPLGALPLPSPVDIYIGEPFSFPETLKEDCSDEEIQTHVSELKKNIETLIKKGLKQKRNYFGQKENAKSKKS